MNLKGGYPNVFLSFAEIECLRRAALSPPFKITFIIIVLVSSLLFSENEQQTNMLTRVHSVA